MIRTEYNTRKGYTLREAVALRIGIAHQAAGRANRRGHPWLAAKLTVWITRNFDYAVKLKG